MPRTLSAALIATSLLLTAIPARADYLLSLDGWPDWVQKSLAEERRLKFRNVSTPDERFTTRLPGKPEIQPLEEGWYFVSDIKAGSPLECYYYSSSRDLGTLTGLIADANIEAVVGRGGTLGERQLFHTGAGEIDGTPFLALEWIYTIQQDTQTLVGFTKVRAAAKGEAAFVCAHNYLGYRETFAQAFAEFVTGANVAAEEPAPFYEEIAKLDMNGIGVGVAYTSFTTDEEGDIRTYTTEAVVMPVDAATVVTSDSYTISYSTPDGELLNAYSISVENGELATNMQLQRNEDGNWVSGGMLQGKDVEFEIDGALQPISELQAIAMTRELFASEATSLDALFWIPSADPTNFLEATTTRDDSEVEGQARTTVGPLSITGRVDEDGHMLDADMQVGPVAIRVQRIWSRGRVPR